MNIAIIPARGGSKRIPRKNIKPFYGLPVIAYAINAAKESDLFDEIIVSTDDNEIAEIARNFGATVPWMRPESLSDDFSTTLSVMHDAVIRLGSVLSGTDNVCCIYPVTPLLNPSSLTRGVEVLESGDWSYVFSGLLANINPQRFFLLGKSKEVKMLFPEFTETRTQDLELTYCDAGQFYWGKKSSWELELPILSSKSTILELSPESVVDIDTPEDWERAEKLFGLRMRR
jgi:N-acylneuraminate cytidylyltransferase